MARRSTPSRSEAPPTSTMVGLGVGSGGEVGRVDVGVAVAAQELDQAQLCDIPRDGGLGDGEAALAEPIDQLVLVRDGGAGDDLEDRALAQALGAGGVGGHQRASAVVRALGRGEAAMRVPKAASERERPRAPGAEPSAMTTSSAPAPPTARSAERTLGIMPPTMTPSAMRRSASPAAIEGMRTPAAPRRASTSGGRTGRE